MECQGTRSRPERPPPPRQARPSTQTAEQSMDQIKSLRDEAYLYIQQGLSCDEQNQTQQAYTLYTKGLVAISKAFECERNIPQTAKTGPKWDSAQKHLHKMEKTKLEIESRVGMLKQLTDVVQSISDPPPSYEMASSTSLEDDMNSILNELDDADCGIDSANATEVFKIDDGVQIFHISPEGHVSAPSYPSALAVYKFTDSQAAAASNAPNRPPAFLQVGNWAYPLIPGSSPALHAFWGAYVFPDVSSEHGGSIGVIIPDTVSSARKSQFENTLNELTALRVQESSEDRLVDEEGEAAPARTSETVAKGIVTAAEWIAWGLGKGAEKAGDLLNYSSGKLTDNLTPEDQPRHIDPRAQKGLQYTRQATGAAVKVSGFLVTKLGDATMALGRQVAPHIKKQGEKYMPASWTKKEGERSRIDDVAEVAVGGIKGWATVYVSLETAARSLARNITDNTVTVVQHKYGPQAGKLTENTMFSAGNIGVAAYNFNNLGVKAIAKRAAKDTGKAVVEDYRDKKSKAGGSEQDTEMDTQPSGSGKPPAPRR